MTLNSSRESEARQFPAPRHATSSTRSTLSRASCFGFRSDRSNSTLIQISAPARGASALARATTRPWARRRSLRALECLRLGFAIDRSSSRPGKASASGPLSIDLRGRRPHVGVATPRGPVSVFPVQPAAYRSSREHNHSFPRSVASHIEDTASCLATSFNVYCRYATGPWGLCVNRHFPSDSI